MCGRFIIDYSWAEIHKAMSIIPASAAGRNDPPRYNVAPTQDVAFVMFKDGKHQLVDGRWWLVPFWAKETPKYPMFNARSETAHEKSSFREAFKSKRCLIPASGYYEWTKNEENGGKDPHVIHLPNKEPFVFAGLWAHNTNLDIISCTILTTKADPAISHLHDRMPIILSDTTWNEWLDQDKPVEDLQELLTHDRGNELLSYRVGREVNSSKASGAQLVEPLS